jgi:hypothetical protein
MKGPNLKHETTCDQRRARFDYRDQDGTLVYASVSLEQQRAFEAAFCDEMRKVEAWMGRMPSTYRRAGRSRRAPFPGFRVTVASKYLLSMALVPAFQGQRGQIMFPAYRVAVGEAAIAHELAHVFFPNGNRMLAEGFAVYMQSEVGGNPAFPNFSKPLDAMVREMAAGPEAIKLDDIDLGALDRVTPPSDLTLRIGDASYGSDHTYPIAGSFVQFLIAKDPDRFAALYSRTPLVPLKRDAGAADRWREIYQVSLSQLQDEWKSRLAASSGSPKDRGAAAIGRLVTA